MCVPEKNPYNPIRTMYSCETLDCLGVHVCSDIDTEARSERALINVKKSPIFKTSDACRRVMLLLLLLLLRERVGERVLPRRISPRSMPPPRHHTHTHTHLRIYGYMHVHALPLFIVVYMYVYTSVSLSLSFSASLSLFLASCFHLLLLLLDHHLSLPLVSILPVFFPPLGLSFSLCRPSPPPLPPPLPPPPPPPFRRAVLSKQRERLCPLVPAVKSWAYFKFAAFYRIRYLSTGCTSKGRRVSLFTHPPYTPLYVPLALPLCAPDKTPRGVGCAISPADHRRHDLC